MDALPDRLYYSLFRIAVGIPLLVGGISKIVALLQGDTGLQEWLLGVFSEEPVPEWMVVLATNILPFAETAIGISLVLGLFPRLGATFGLLTFSVFLFGAELTHYVEGMIIDIIQQLLFVLGFFFVAHFADGDDPLRILPRRDPPE